jgi:hypothetical protein
VQIHLPDLAPTTHRLDRIANRLAVSVLSAAFIMALAWLIPAMDLTRPWGVATWFVVVAFVTANLLGLLWNIWRSG